MIKLLIGKKGVGKTKRLIEMANEMVKTTHGQIVYIDDDRRHIFDLNSEIRFVETIEFPLSNYREFMGFVCGILSQNSDITEIFVDGLSNVVKRIEMEDFLKLKVKLDRLSSDKTLDFIISYDCELQELPEELRALVI